MSARLLSVREALLRFLKWWGSELRSCASDLANRIAPRWRRPLTIYADAGRLMIVDPEPGNEKSLVELTRPNFRSALPAHVSEASGIIEVHGRRARIVVNSAQAFARTLTLPLAALAHLRSAVRLQLPKLLPMDTSLLLSDFRVTGTDAEKGLVHIDLVALKRSDVDLITHAVGAWGFTVSKVQLADQPASDARFTFLGRASAVETVAVGRSDRYWLGAATLLGLACAAVGVAQSYRADAALETAKQQTTGAASMAMQREERLSSRLEPLAALSQLEGSPSAANILAEISALVPHDTWLTTFEIKDHRVRLVGISPNPAALVRFLNASVLLTDFELRSSMSAGIGTEKDRFEITAELKAPTP